MKKLRIIFSVILLAAIYPAVSQTLDEAGEAFNQGIAAQQQSDFQTAVNSYQKAYDIANKLGDEGIDLSLKAQKQLTSAYFSLGKSQYVEKKYNEALQNFLKSAGFAKLSADDKTLDASNTYIAGINTSLGNNFLKAEELDKAMEKYTEALKYKPEYAKAYYGIGLVYKKKDDLDKMKESLDKAIALAGQDEKTITSAKDAAGNAFLNAGAKELQGNSYEKSLEYLNIYLTYDATNPKSYYYLALANNGLKKWDDALTAANKAFELETDDKSDIYFEIGKAYEGKTDATAACDAYKSVTAGNNVAAAKYQREQVLKCK
jgi:tetratricopeptide (TPR) repeat protein